MSLRARGAVLFILVSVVSFAAACGGGGGLFGRQYEYEEDLFLALDGSARLTVNASMAALVALRGLDVPLDPDAAIDRDRVRALFSSPATNVTHVSRGWRRAGRRFVQVRLEVPDIRRLTEAAPFAWSTYDLVEADGEHVFRQRIGASAFQPGTLQQVGWTGREIVAFRVHLPSRIRYHNARDIDTLETHDTERGNILRWEQYMADRLDGVPIDVEVRMDSQSILYQTLWLFATAFLAAVSLLGFLVWLMFRRGARQTAIPPSP
ncbi:hypothetical protein BH23ACI1_BH23ACI1_06810 [soil metagenome]|nr:hypothetical protein [Acidobacteriota bacterium]